MLYENRVDPDQLASIEFTSGFIQFLKSLCMLSAVKFFMHYLFIGTSRIFIGLEHYCHLLVLGPV